MHRWLPPTSVATPLPPPIELPVEVGNGMQRSTVGGFHVGDLTESQNQMLVGFMLGRVGLVGFIGLVGA